MTIEEIITTLSVVNENTSIEELRRLIADTVENLNSAVLDITALNSELASQTEANQKLGAEIDRLKEENGRLFRERLGEFKEKKEEVISDDEKITKLEKEIDY